MSHPETGRIRAALIASVLACCLAAPSVARQEAPAPAPVEADGAGEADPAEPEVMETVNVTAEFLGDTFSPESISTAVAEVGEVPGARTAVDVATTLPGVSENGQAGIFQVLSVRGVSRQRLLTFIDGMRVSSERRAGVSASFLDPFLISEVEVARGPASTYYGAGALGGALQLFPRDFERLSAAVGYQSQGDEVSQRIGWGNERFSLGLAHRRAGDSETPDGETLFSRFEQTSGTFRARFGGGAGLLHDVSLIGSRGDDIGKASLDYPDRITTYPRERHGFLRYEISSGARWRGRIWSHAQDLVTDAFRPAGGQRNVVETSSLDFGGKFEHRLPTNSDRWDGRLGVDVYGRRDVDSLEAFQAPAGTDSFRSLNGAEEDELAGYGVVNWSWSQARFETGVRHTEGRQDAGESLLASGGSRSRSATTAFFGAAVTLREDLRLVGNIGRGVRFPSLTEQFFAGTTGRGEILGNPDLEEETSTNVEASLRWVRGGGSWTLSAYHNEIDDYVERVELAPGLLGFVNLTSGRIRGVEVQGFTRLGHVGSPWRLDLAAHWMDGEAEDGSTLADIPPHRIRTGLAWTGGRWSARGSLAWRASKDDVGPSERAIDSAWVLDGAVTWSVTPDLDLELQLTNGLDEEYFPAADDEAPPAAGRSVGLAARWSPF